MRSDGASDACLYIHERLLCEVEPSRTRPGKSGREAKNILSRRHNHHGSVILL